MEASWPERCHKTEFAGGDGDTMQAKGKKLGQGVSMKNLTGAHFEVASSKTATNLRVAGRLQKGCIRIRTEMTQGIGGKQPKARGEGARVKTSRYGYNQRKNQSSNSKS